MAGRVREVVKILSAPCREHTTLISRGLDGATPPEIRLALRAHFLVCGPCRRFAHQLRFIRRAARLLGAGAAAAPISGRMPDDVRHRLSQRLRVG
jgi:hypothetical protein